MLAYRTNPNAPERPRPQRQPPLPDLEPCIHKTPLTGDRALYLLPLIAFCLNLR